MATVKFNDGIGSRDLRHRNLVVIPGQGIVEFVGENIAPVVRVLKEEYEKNGRWSKTTWTVELNGALPFVFSQNWETGKYHNARTVSQAVADFSAKLPDGHNLSDRQVEQALWALWPQTMTVLAKAEQSFLNQDQLTALLDAQQEAVAAQQGAARVVAEIEATAETNRLREQAQRLRAAAAKTKSGAMSLADLKALMG